MFLNKKEPLRLFFISINSQNKDTIIPRFSNRTTLTANIIDCSWVGNDYDFTWCIHFTLCSKNHASAKLQRDTL